MAFGRKKIEKPKSILGFALFRLDQILNIRLKGVIHAVRSKKRVKIRSAAALADNIAISLETIMEDISKENFKTDYRSDKIRDAIIIMINNLNSFLNNLKEGSFEIESNSSGMGILKIDEIFEIRESLRVKLKDIESDYI